MIMQNIYTVAQINTYIKNMFTQDYLLQSVQVQGEVSNCKYHSSGHIYFTLKDKKGTLSCVMFAGNRKSLDFTLTEGQQVIVEGSVDIYERDGKYQLQANSITEDGIGLARSCTVTFGHPFSLNLSASCITAFLVLP